MTRAEDGTCGLALSEDERPERDGYPADRPDRRELADLARDLKEVQP